MNTKKTIFNKILFLIIAISAIGALSALVITANIHGAQMKEDLIQKNLLMTRIVSKDIETGYLARRWPFAVLEDISNSPDVLFWWVVKPSGEIELADDPQVWGKKIDDPSLGTAEYVIKDAVFYKTGEKIKLIAYPLKLEFGQLHTFYLGISLKSIYAFYKEIIITNFILLAAIIISIFLLSFYFVKGLVGPIESLTEGIKIIGKGNFDHQVQIRTGDEIEDLANAFNAMTADLSKSREQIEDYSKELEKKINEKTQSLENARIIMEKKNQELADSQKVLLNLTEDSTEAKTIAEKENTRREAILNSIGEGLIVTDDKNRIIDINPIVEKLFSLKEEEIVNREARGLFKNEKIEASLMKIGKEKEFFEISINAEEGEKIYKTLVTPVVSTNGEILGRVMTMNDLTKEKEVEEMRKRFVSITAHELRTPLGANRWSLELLKSGDIGLLSDQQRGILDQMYNSNQRLLSIVADLLEISRIDEARFAMEFKPTQLEDLVDTAAGELTLKMKEKNQYFVWQRPEKALPKAMADSNRVMQVLINLLSNAIKFTPDNKRIEVLIEEDSRVAPPDIVPVLTLKQTARKYLRVSVKDDGIGIPLKEQKKIFERFFRTSNAQEKQIEGTGLGLNISKSIVELHGGAIWFESEEGKGTTFYFTIPIYQEKI